MKEEESKKFNNLCDEFTEVFERVSATFEMMNQFQRNPTEVSEASKTGSTWLMDDAIESLETLKSKFYTLNKDMRDSKL